MKTSLSTLLAASILFAALPVGGAAASPTGVLDSAAADDRCVLAEQRNRQGKFEDSRQILLKVLAAREKVFGAESEQVAKVMVQLARNSFDACQYHEADSQAKRALAIDEKLFGKDSCQAGRDLDLLNKIYKKVAPEKAAAIEDRAMQIKSTMPSAPPMEIMKNPVVTMMKGEAAATESAPVEDKWALVIGVSQFKDPAISLKYAAKDATDFAQFLTGSANFKSDHVKLLTDADANRGNIVDAVGEGFLGKAKKNDLVVIYVSSHGGADSKSSIPLNFLLPYDANARNLLANGIPMEWFSQIIEEEIQSDRVVVFLDVCHSGAATAVGPAHSTATDSSADSSSDPGNKGLARSRSTATFDVMNVTPRQGQIFICSSLANQLSWESKKYPNSVFTRQLIESLTCKGAQTSLAQDFDALRTRVEEEVLDDRMQEQTPVMKRTWNGDDLRFSDTCSISQTKSADHK